jgi:hypothetical protein
MNMGEDVEGLHVEIANKNPLPPSKSIATGSSQPVKRRNEVEK